MKVNVPFLIVDKIAKDPDFKFRVQGTFSGT